VCYNLKRVVESIFLNAHQISNITKDEEWRVIHKLNSFQ
jgi:hypothetical protein